MVYSNIFIVRGIGEFPFDMLRYDGCYPRSQEDVARLHAHTANGIITPRDVTLESISVRKDFAPCAKRWESFGWKVVQHERFRYI